MVLPANCPVINSSSDALNLWPPQIVTEITLQPTVVGRGTSRLPETLTSGHLWAPAGHPRFRHLMSAPHGAKARVAQWLSQSMLLAAH
jgi:hypothetical protein